DFIDLNASDAYYLSLPRPYRSARGARFATVDELYRVRGFDARVVEKLRPYVTALPVQDRVAVNANTATDVVLAALYGTDRAKVAPIIAERGAKPFDSREGFVQRMQQEHLPTTNLVDVKSSWFSVRVAVQQDDVQLAAEALVKRRPDGAATIV